MDLQRELELDERLQVFTFGFLQDAYNLIHICEEHNISIPELLDYITTKKCAKQTEQAEHQHKVELWKKAQELHILYGRKCPNCNTPLDYEPYTSCQQKIIVNGVAGAFICPNEECDFWEHTNLNREQYLESLKILSERG